MAHWNPLKRLMLVNPMRVICSRTTSYGPSSHLCVQSSSLSTTSLRSICTTTLLHNRNVRFEPPYINDPEPKIATYPLIDIRMRGFDYTVLQAYQKWVGRTARNMGLTIANSFAIPCSSQEVTSLKKGSDVVEEIFKFNIYKRTVQISNLPAPVVPVLLEVLLAGLPEGVELLFDHHQVEDDVERFVPNKELLELRQEYHEIDNPVVKTKWTKPSPVDS